MHTMNLDIATSKARVNYAQRLKEVNKIVKANVAYLNVDIKPNINYNQIMEKPKHYTGRYIRKEMSLVKYVGFQATK